MKKALNLFQIYFSANIVTTGGCIMEQVKLFFKKPLKKYVFIYSPYSLLQHILGIKKQSLKWTIYRMMKYSGRNYCEKAKRIF